MGRRCDFPSAPKELDGAGGTDAPGNVQREMQIEQFFLGRSLQFGASLAQRFLPGVIGRRVNRGVAMVFIVILDLLLQKLIGTVVVGDFFVGKERDQAFLERAEEPFDFAFGLGRRRHAMIDPQRAEGPLELACGVQAIGR